MDNAIQRLNSARPVNHVWQGVRPDTRISPHLQTINNSLTVMSSFIADTFTESITTQRSITTPTNKSHPLQVWQYGLIAIAASVTLFYSARLLSQTINRCFPYQLAPDIQDNQQNYLMRLHEMSTLRVKEGARDIIKKTAEGVFRRFLTGMEENLDGLDATDIAHSDTNTRFMLAIPFNQFYIKNHTALKNHDLWLKTFLFKDNATLVEDDLNALYSELMLLQLSALKKDVESAIKVLGNKKYSASIQSLFGRLGVSSSKERSLIKSYLKISLTRCMDIIDLITKNPADALIFFHQGTLCEVNAFVSPCDKDHHLQLSNQLLGRNAECQKKTLLHEISHFSDAAGTGDYLYATDLQYEFSLLSNRILKTEDARLQTARMYPLEWPLNIKKVTSPLVMAVLKLNNADTFAWIALKLAQLDNAVERGEFVLGDAWETLPALPLPWAGRAAHGLEG